MKSRTHKSYRLRDDSIEVAAEMAQLASNAFCKRKEEYEEAKQAYEEAKAYVEAQEAKLIELLSRKGSSIIYNRVKYSVKDGKLVKELILD